MDRPQLDDDAHPVTAGTPPPPISGGTLLVTRDGATAVASDPDRDLVYGVDLATPQHGSTASLCAGDLSDRTAYLDSL